MKSIEQKWNRKSEATEISKISGRFYIDDSFKHNNVYLIRDLEDDKSEIARFGTIENAQRLLNLLLEISN